TYFPEVTPVTAEWFHQGKPSLESILHFSSFYLTVSGGCSLGWIVGLGLLEDRCCWIVSVFNAIALPDVTLYNRS
ncbi:hypothetical protein AAIH16_43415, partial [Pseudomonas aeruginosa]